jgi:hypothetical protein
LTTLQQQWRADARGLRLDRASFEAARAVRRAAARTPFDRARLAMRQREAAFTRADLIEIVGAQLPSTPNNHRARSSKLRSTSSVCG